MTGVVCTCTNSVTKTLPSTATGCPATIPADWTTTTDSEISKPSSQIPYSSFNEDGALIHCASSRVTVYEASITDTLCAGSTSTDSVSTGVTPITSILTATEAPVQSGNWLWYTGTVTTGTGAYNATAAAFDLAGSFYTAFSSACATTGTPTISSTKALSTVTFSTLPGGAVGSVTTVTEPVTYYACSPTEVVVTPWAVSSDESSGGIDSGGSLAVALIESHYSLQNRDTWLWNLAWAVAYSTANSFSLDYTDNPVAGGYDATSTTSNLYPFFTVPKEVRLIYGNNLDNGLELEVMTAQMVWEKSEASAQACLITEGIEKGLMLLLNAAIGPEAQISMEMKTVVSAAIQVSRMVFSCYSD